MYYRIRLLIPILVALSCLPLGAAPPPAHDQFRVAIYIPAAVVEKMKDPAWLEQSWQQISSQVKVDKVYIESYRSHLIVDGATLDKVKAFFEAHGVQTAGGICFSAKDTGGFISYSYTDPEQRAYVKHISELTARHFNEIILDDFFFYNTKTDADIAAKGNESWTDFRLRMMDDVSRDLVVGAAKAVNPKVKVIIKFPNWYEHFQANGYDLDQEPKIFDGIYTGTETRDPDTTEQHLQQYESYEIIRYFDNISPGRNGGGWVDPGATAYLDRYAEQLWDTMLAKAPQIMLFQYGDLVRQPPAGDRKAWSGLDTTFNYTGLNKWHAAMNSATPINYATVVGYSLSKVNEVVGKLGNPIGIASYKPYQSTGEDFLHNYLGMIGIPIELYPEFPDNAKTVLLTESAKFDPDIVSKIKKHLENGGNVVITSGLLSALAGKGIEQIAEIYNTHNVLKVNDYWGASCFDCGNGLKTSQDILMPELSFMTNDAWALVRGSANGRGAPLLLMDRYSKGTFYVLTIPENTNDLYSLPQPVLTALKHYLLEGFPVQIDAPSKVSLFAYDNRTFVVESYRDQPAPVTVSLPGSEKRLRNLATGEVLEGKAPAPVNTPRKHQEQTASTEFHITVQPHSFVAFAEEQ